MRWKSEQRQRRGAINVYNCRTYTPVLHRASVSDAEYCSDRRLRLSRIPAVKSVPEGYEGLMVKIFKRRMVLLAMLPVVIGIEAIEGMVQGLWYWKEEWQRIKEEW